MVINNLKVLRAKHGLKAKFIAFACGVSAQTISNWERNITKPSLENMIAILKIYHDMGHQYTLNDLYEIRFEN